MAVVVALAIGALTMAMGSPAHALALRAGGLDLEFAGRGKGRMGAISVAESALQFRAGAPADTFALEVRTKDGTQTLGPEGAQCTVREEPGAVVHEYRFASPPVTVVTRAAVRGDALELTASAKAAGEGAGIGALTYPLLNGMGRPGGDAPEDYVLFPFGCGWRMPPRNPGFEFRQPHAYPSVYCSMQMMAYCLEDGQTLYLTTPDPRSRTKSFLYYPEGDAFVWGVTHYPEGMYATRSYEMPYPVVMRLIRGDWYDVARAYREWALKQPWVDGGKLRYRHDLPERVRDNVWSLCDNANMADAAAMASLDIAVRDFLQAPVLTHMYMWHEKIWRMDVLYPEYLPPIGQFPETVQRLQAADIPVMPYVNARLWDQKSPTWAAENAVSAACTGEDGVAVVEIGDELRTLTVMDPTTPLWQDKLLDICDRVFHEVGCLGIYLDQIAAAPPVLDFSPGRTHLAGGGDWWVRGYEQMLGRIHGKLMPAGSGRFLTTEATAEPYQRYVAAYLAYTGGREMVPLFPAVYNETVMMFGGTYDKDHAPLCRLEFANDLLYGSMPGWQFSERFRPALLQEQYRPLAEFAAKIAAVRAADVHMFSLSELLRPPVVEGDNPVLEATRDRGPLAIRRAVQSGAFRSEDDRVGLCLVNCDDRPHQVTARFPVAAERVYAVVSAREQPQTVSLVEGAVAVEMPAASAVLYVTRPADVPTAVE